MTDEQLTTGPLNDSVHGVSSFHLSPGWRTPRKTEAEFSELSVIIDEDKLDSFHGDFNQAEMVKAFIGSSEYRHRFGQ